MFQKGFSFSGFERDMVTLNQGGKRFLDISGVSGADSITDGRATVYADFDNDGDLDLFLTAKHGPAYLLYRNERGQDQRFLRIALEGRKSGRDGFGAVVRVKTPLGIHTRIKSGGTGFLSQIDPRLLFGLGVAERVEWIEVTWPSGLKQRLEGRPAGESILVVEGEPKVKRLEDRRFRLPDPVTSQARARAMVRVAPGQPLPSLKVAAEDGSRALPTLLEPGKPTLINFWSSGCAPCAREMPELERLSGRLQGRLTVIGVNLDGGEDRKKAVRLLKRLGITYPGYTAKAEELEALFAGRQPEIPLSLLVGADGRLLEVFTGWSRETRRRIEEVAGR